MSTYRPHRRAVLAFTLIELLIVVAIIAISLTMGVPSLTRSIQENRMSTQANDFLAALNYARSEAVKRGSRITLCKVKGTDFSKCDNAGKWSDGWLIFVDTANGFSSSPLTLTPTASNILKVHQLLATSTLTGNGSLANYTSYTGLGTMQFASGSSPKNDGTDNFKLCSSASPATQGRSIVFNSVGRATVSKVNCP